MTYKYAFILRGVGGGGVALSKSLTCLDRLLWQKSRKMSWYRGFSVTAAYTPRFSAKRAPADCVACACALFRYKNALIESIECLLGGGGGGAGDSSRAIGLRPCREISELNLLTPLQRLSSAPVVIGTGPWCHQGRTSRKP